MIKDRLLARIVDGRTDLVLDYVAQGHAATAETSEGVRLLQWCAYFGDVSAIRFLLKHGETPLHRAAAFGTENTIDLLLRAGAARESKDVNGDTPLSWASWYARPDGILRRLCYGTFSIPPDRSPMQVALLGRPHGRS